VDQRQRRKITPEAVALFRTGVEILAQGADENWEDDLRSPGRRREFLDIDKRLNITLLGQGWHAVSVFDAALDGPMPGYIANLCAGHDWAASRALRQALLDRAGKGGDPDAPA
jgi:hypothetical protein